MTAATPQRISEVLSPLMVQLTEAKRPTADEVGRLWRRLVGTQAAQHSHPTSLRRGELLVAVDTSAWLWHLSLRRPKLLSGFHAAWGPDSIATIRLRIKTV